MPPGYALICCCAAAMLAGCGGSQPSTPVVGSAPLQRVLGASMGNIYWNKAHLFLKYPPYFRKKAVLTYWAPNGYYAEPPYCKREGTFSATAGRQSGNPKGYMHVVYWFEAKSAGPNDCAFTAVLNGTGSPPIAVLKLRIR